MRSLVAAMIVCAFVLLFAVLARFGGESARAQQQAPAKCKLFKGSKCCKPAITVHLAKEAVFTACGESEATYLGEQSSTDTCKYFFKVAGAKEEDTGVQVYAPKQK